MSVYRLNEKSGLRKIIIAHWRGVILNLSIEDEIPQPISWIFLGCHLAGLLAIVRLTHRPIWFALVVLLLLQPLIVSLKTRKPYFLVASLTPLVIAYAVLLLRIMIASLYRLQSGIPGPLTVPQPWGNLLNLNLATIVSVLWALLSQTRVTLDVVKKRDVHWLVVIGYSMLGLSILWSSLTYFLLRARGVTGSDPYAYVQMAVDFAQNGTFLHTFDLVPRVSKWNLPLWPTVPVGYLSPDPQTGSAATVWPPGYSAFLAVSYLIMGETGIYITTPLFGIFAILAMWYLSIESLNQWPEGKRIAAAGFAVFVLATSYQQIEHLLLPFADIPSQLFTVLAFLFAIRSGGRRTALFAFLSGICLGVAFSIRYTQVLLAPSLLVAHIVDSSCCNTTLYQRSKLSRGDFVRALVWRLFWFAVGAWLAALPVLRYHQIAFGNPFKVGSQELSLFALHNVPLNFIGISRDLLRTNEFFYILPFIVVGVFRLWKNFRCLMIALLLWPIAIVSFHLPYRALRIRDLLSIFPVIALFASVGMADLLGRFRYSYNASELGKYSIILFLVIISLFLRTRVTWQLPFSKAFNTFGYLTEEQRLSFSRLSIIIPRNGIVAASLNSGPIILYANRPIVRPAYWSEEEWLKFIDLSSDSGQRIFILIDGEEMKKPFSLVRSRYRTIYISKFSMPYFNIDSGSINSLVELYEVIP